MSDIRNSKLQNILCVFFALLIFNTSIDTPDVMFTGFKENPNLNVVNTELNDIETMTELVLEDVLEIEDAIPEEEEPDNQNHGINLFAKVSFFHQPTVNKSQINTNPASKRDISFLYKEPRYISQFIEVSTPPPKA